MKEFAVKHPVVTFLAVVVVCDTVLKLGKIIGITKVHKNATLACACSAILNGTDTDAEINKEETDNDEPAGDIQ